MIQNWSNYGKFYYQNHRDAFREYQRRYLEKVKTAILYRVKDENQEIIYFGSSDSPFRLNFHFGKYSKLNMKNRDWTMEYVEIDSISRDELYFIEYFLINLYDPILNIIKPSLDLEKFDFITNERKEELIQITEHLQFKIFTLN